MNASSMTGETLAQLLREMADRVQRNIDDSSSIRDKLKDVVARLEEERKDEDA